MRDDSSRAQLLIGFRFRRCLQSHILPFRFDVCSRCECMCVSVEQFQGISAIISVINNDINSHRDCRLRLRSSSWFLSLSHFPFIFHSLLDSTRLPGTVSCAHTPECACHWSFTFAVTNKSRGLSQKCDAMKTTFAQTQRKYKFNKFYLYFSKRQNRNKTRKMKRNGMTWIESAGHLSKSPKFQRRRRRTRDKEQQAEKCRRNVTDLQRNNQIKLILTWAEERPERVCVSCERLYNWVNYCFVCTKLTLISISSAVVLVPHYNTLLALAASVRVCWNEHTYAPNFIPSLFFLHFHSPTGHIYLLTDLYARCFFQRIEDF